GPRLVNRPNARHHRRGEKQKTRCESSWLSSDQQPDENNEVGDRYADQREGKHQSAFFLGGLLSARFHFRRAVRRFRGWSDPDLRLVIHRNFHRRGDETEVVRGVVELECPLLVAARRDRYRWAKRDALEA